VDELIDAADDINPDLYVFTLKNSTPDPNYGIALQYDPLLADVNGHFWMSPVNAKILTKKICANLTDYAPANQTSFESNRDTYLGELDQLLWRIGNFSKWFYNGTRVIVMHPAFFYLFNLLGINRTAVVEKTEGVEPSAADIAVIISYMRENDVGIVVTNPQHDDESAIEIARDTGAKLAYLTPLLGVYDLQSYIDMIDYDMFALSPAALRDPPTDPIEALMWLWITIGAVAAGAFIAALIWRYRGVS
jgi:ABC-type Zn uptake system ZnuABC Zn-binding protein ZnuA